MLSVMDSRWREHLYEMDYLKEGIGLRAMAQRDPLVEYQREGYEMFNEMKAGIKEDVVGYIYNLEVQVQKAEPVVPRAVSDLLRTTTATGAALAAAAQRVGEQKTADGAVEPASASEPGSDEEDPFDENGIVLTAKGLDDGPRSGQLRYSSAEGSGVQDEGSLSRAERRRRAKQAGSTGASAAGSTTSNKPEGAPAENRGPRGARRRKG